MIGIPSPSKELRVRRGKTISVALTKKKHRKIFLVLLEERLQDHGGLV